MSKTAHPDNLINKKHSVYDMYHEVCERFLAGNGSMITPYVCDCGTWSYDADHCEWRLQPKKVWGGLRE